VHEDLGGLADIKDAVDVRQSTVLEKLLISIEHAQAHGPVLLCAAGKPT
jgi:hypothetical protein